MTDTNLLMSITIIVFIVMYLGAIIFLQKGFLKPQTLFNIMNANAALIILSCGMTLVMITGGIDISVGGVAALVSMSCAVYLDYHGGNIIGAILISVGIGLAFGLVQGYLVAYLEIQPFIVTLAGMFFARGMTTIVHTNPFNVQNEAFVKLKDARIIVPFLGSVNKHGIYVDAYVEIGIVVALLILIHGIVSIFIIVVFLHEINQRLPAAKKPQRILRIGDASGPLLISAVTAPRIAAGPAFDPRLHRILKNIPQHSLKITLVIHRLAPEPILKQMPDPMVLFIVPANIFAAEPFVDHRQRLPGRFNQHMDMVGHQAERMQPESGLLLAVFQTGHEIMAVPVIFKNHLPVNPAVHNVIYIGDTGLSRFSWHLQPP